MCAPSVSHLSLILTDQWVRERGPRKFLPVYTTHAHHEIVIKVRFVEYSHTSIDKVTKGEVCGDIFTITLIQ